MNKTEEIFGYFIYDSIFNIIFLLQLILILIAVRHPLKFWSISLITVVWEQRCYYLSHNLSLDVVFFQSIWMMIYIEHETTAMASFYSMINRPTFKRQCDNDLFPYEKKRSNTSLFFSSFSNALWLLNEQG
jgi:hypothetical protein